MLHMTFFFLISLADSVVRWIQGLWLMYLFILRHKTKDYLIFWNCEAHVFEILKYHIFEFTV